ncbi:hypothetical protein Droror1_Dr00023613 [Drosera rotundifolia]
MTPISDGDESQVKVAKDLLCGVRQGLNFGEWWRISGRPLASGSFSGSRRRWRHEKEVAVAADSEGRLAARGLGETEAEAE